MEDLHWNINTVQLQSLYKGVFMKWLCQELETEDTLTSSTLEVPKRQCTAQRPAESVRNSQVV